MSLLFKAARCIFVSQCKFNSARGLNPLFATTYRSVHNGPNTYDFARERIMLLLRMFDKIDPEKLTLDSHFYNDLGLDSLDHADIIMHLEDEFNYEIPDRDFEKLLTPSDILRYITDHDEAYEELQRLEIEDHHNHHHDHAHNDNHNSHAHATKNACLDASKRHFSTSSRIFKEKKDVEENPFEDIKKSYILTSPVAENEMYTSFNAKRPQPIDHQEFHDRVMKVIKAYDKIDASKVNITSHFFQDLGLDSLDHIEIIMELEDEFGFEIPDDEAEKLFTPGHIIKYVINLEIEKKPTIPEDRHF